MRQATSKQEHSSLSSSRMAGRVKPGARCFRVCLDCSRPRPTWRSTAVSLGAPGATGGAEGGPASPGTPACAGWPGPGGVPVASCVLYGPLALRRRDSTLIDAASSNAPGCRSGLGCSGSRLRYNAPTRRRRCAASDSDSGAPRKGASARATRLQVGVTMDEASTPVFYGCRARATQPERQHCQWLR